ncbi:MAG: hypothetical protein ACP5FN_02730 [Candidatus Micrarchaeia archaeon]
MDNNNAGAPNAGSTGNASMNTQPIQNQMNTGAAQMQPQTQAQAQPNAKGAGTTTKPKLKFSSKTGLIAGAVIVLIIIAAVFSLSSSSASASFPSAAQISSIYNAKFVASPLVSISKTNSSVQEFAAYGLESAELENYTNSSFGVIRVGALQFKSQGNVSKLFSALSLVSPNVTQYNGGEYIVEPSGTEALGYKNNVLLIVGVEMNPSVNMTVVPQTSRLMQLMLNGA